MYDPVINPTNLQHIIEFVISLNRSYIKSLYFEKIKYTYKIISFNLFGHIRGALKKELRRPIAYDKLVSDKDNYKWMEADFLPKLHDDIDLDIKAIQERCYYLHMAHEDFTYHNVPISLSTPEFVYNYVYDLHPTDLIPIFETYVKTSLFTPSNTPPELISEIKSFLIERFLEFDMELVFV